MPRRNDIKKIMLIGSGPIVIGQACEFDYSGTQACKALREEGYEVVLVNSNPATIMTDPEMADRTYIEPITAEVCERIIAQERPDALLPTVGGQTALNVAVELAQSGALERHGVELVGAKLEAIQTAEDRELFKKAMDDAGLDMPPGYFVNSEQAQQHVDELGFPIIIRPSFTMGGSGGGVAYNREEFDQIVTRGIELSPIDEVLIEISVLGWKEYELEVMRDLNDNVVIICSIENFDAMGIHTGDSITVAPAQTLSDKEYQVCGDAAIRVIRRIGVDTGGSNIQFAVDPATGKMVVIEMNPRVSRSSALASKATGFPIAKIAAKLAVGYTLDEIPNDITRETPASFEPTIDYVVTKIPRWAFEKFPGTPDTLDTQMRSVGETMAIGRTFHESFQKAMRSLEIGRAGWGADGKDLDPLRMSDAEVREGLVNPSSQRLFFIRAAMAKGFDVDQIHRLCRVDPWFLDRLVEIFDAEREIAAHKDLFSDRGALWQAKAMGFSDRQLAFLCSTTESEVRRQRWELGVRPVYKTVDTCAAEFEAFTPYHYSSYEQEQESVASDRRKIMILGGGPNRIGQGIEFDYCCVHACFALREDGFETIMVNSNPETVSTDYDTADKLYFEPLTVEDVLHIVEHEKPEGVIVQFGGQTPLNLALELEANGVPIIGTSPSNIDLAEDREHFGNLLRELGIRQPENGMARSIEEARAVADRIGYPVLVRPSYVLGGRAMVTVYDEARLDQYMATAISVSPEHPILIDRFLEAAQEFDVDVVADGEQVMIGGIMQHIEHAGVHSGDSACVLPPHDITPEHLETIIRDTRQMARGLNVIGLMNVQYAIHDGEVYVLEVNPRASRTVPFVSKATGRPLAKIAARVMSGTSLAKQGYSEDAWHVRHVSVKEAVLPFNKFAGADGLLGPEMKSTGEVMGIGHTFGEAFLKAQLGAGSMLPSAGKVFLSVNDRDKEGLVDVASRLHRAGFELIATGGTQAYLARHGIQAERMLKVHEGRPHVEDAIRSREICLVINSPQDEQSQQDDAYVRRAAIMHGVPYTTTLAGAIAAATGIEALLLSPPQPRAVQDYHRAD